MAMKISLLAITRWITKFSCQFLYGSTEHLKGYQMIPKSLVKTFIFKNYKFKNLLQNPFPKHQLTTFTVWFGNVEYVCVKTTFRAPDYKNIVWGFCAGERQCHWSLTTGHELSLEAHNTRVQLQSVSNAQNMRPLQGHSNAICTRRVSITAAMVLSLPCSWQCQKEMSLRYHLDFWL